MEKIACLCIFGFYVDDFPIVVGAELFYRIAYISVGDEFQAFGDVVFENVSVTLICAGVAIVEIVDVVGFVFE